MAKSMKKKESLTDLDKTETALSFTIDAWFKQAKALASKQYSKMETAELAKCHVNTGKMINDIGRFVLFKQGGADSRIDITGENFINISDLEDDQFKIVMKFYEENLRKKEIAERK